MNEIYGNYFSEATRSTIATDLVRPNMLIEIECIAYKPDN